MAQGAQVLFVVLFAPLLKGFMDRFRARLAGRRGPPYWQPYRDLRKWMHKETIRTREASWVSVWAPAGYFVGPVLVAMLIPVLTAFPLPFAWMGDMLAGGMILGGSGFWLLLAAMDSGGVYPVLGVSRMRLVGVFLEPLVFVLIFGAAEIGQATIPFVVNQAVAQPRWAITPTHALLVLGWFLFLLGETGRIPIDNPGSAQELSMIDPARTFESSGWDLALYEWGGWMKFLVLSLVLTNVLITPWGLATGLSVGAIALSLVMVAVKVVAVGVVVIMVEASFAKLRLLRNVDFLVAGAVLAALGSLGATLF